MTFPSTEVCTWALRKLPPTLITPELGTYGTQKAGPPTEMAYAREERDHDVRDRTHVATTKPAF